MSCSRVEKDICVVWSTFDTNIFSEVHFSKLHWVYKLAQAKKPTLTLLKVTQFYTIFKVSNENLTTPVGYIFYMNIPTAKTSFTQRALAAKFNSNYTQIKNSSKKEMWSEKGIQVINYSSVAEVVTDLGSILNVTALK